MFLVLIVVVLFQHTNYLAKTDNGDIKLILYLCRVVFYDEYIYKYV